jgi:hypothetical protein
MKHLKYFHTLPCGERRELVLMNINLSILSGTVLTASIKFDFSCRHFISS